MLNGDGDEVAPAEGVDVAPAAPAIEVAPVAEEGGANIDNEIDGEIGDAEGFEYLPWGRDELSPLMQKTFEELSDQVRRCMRERDLILDDRVVRRFQRIWDRMRDDSPHGDIDNLENMFLGLLPCVIDALTTYQSRREKGMVGSTTRIGQFLPLLKAMNEMSSISEYCTHYFLFAIPPRLRPSIPTGPSIARELMEVAVDEDDCDWMFDRKHTYGITDKEIEEYKDKFVPV